MGRGEGGKETEERQCEGEEKEEGRRGVGVKCFLPSGKDVSVEGLVGAKAEAEEEVDMKRWDRRWPMGEMKLMRYGWI